jgi:hypothetical protein
MIFTINKYPRCGIRPAAEDLTLSWANEIGIITEAITKKAWGNQGLRLKLEC